jgi:hypothetical protein
MQPLLSLKLSRRIVDRVRKQLVRAVCLVAGHELIPLHPKKGAKHIDPGPLAVYEPVTLCRIKRVSALMLVPEAPHCSAKRLFQRILCRPADLIRRQTKIPTSNQVNSVRHWCQSFQLRPRNRFAVAKWSLDKLVSPAEDQQSNSSPDLHMQIRDLATATAMFARPRNEHEHAKGCQQTAHQQKSNPIVEKDPG